MLASHVEDAYEHGPGRERRLRRRLKLPEVARGHGSAWRAQCAYDTVADALDDTQLVVWHVVCD